MELYLNAYVHDELQRGFTTNISETGIFLNTLMHERLPPLTTVGLEFTLPGIGETIWAAGEIRFDAMDDYFLGRGIRFTAMAQSATPGCCATTAITCAQTNRRRH